MLGFVVDFEFPELLDERDDPSPDAMASPESLEPDGDVCLLLEFSLVEKVLPLLFTLLEEELLLAEELLTLLELGDFTCFGKLGKLGVPGAA